MPGEEDRNLPKDPSGRAFPGVPSRRSLPPTVSGGSLQAATRHRQSVTRLRIGSAMKVTKDGAIRCDCRVQHGRVLRISSFCARRHLVRKGAGDGTAPAGRGRDGRA